jgi:hypothetical protein
VSPTTKAMDVSPWYKTENRMLTSSNSLLMNIEPTDDDIVYIPKG